MLVPVDELSRVCHVQMHLFKSDPDAEERALAAIAKAEWTHDSAQAAIASLSGQAPSLQEVPAPLRYHSCKPCWH